MDLNKNIDSSLPEMAFMIGIGRSGTTLLTNMLNSNPGLVSTPENEFLLFTESSYLSKDFSDAKVLDSFLNVFNYDYNKVLSIWKPSAELKMDIKHLKNKSLGNVSKLVYLNYPLAEKSKENVKCIIDKNPVYSLYIENIHRIYPNARFIVLVRDFRDNVLSRKKYADKESSLFGLAAAWNYYYKRIFKSLDSLGLNYTIVKYEDLVSDSAKTLKEICNFLNVDYSEEMLHFQGLSRKMKEHIRDTSENKVYAKISNMHSNLDKAVNTERINAYEKELNEEEISILNYVCAETGKRFGYLEEEKMNSVPLSWKIKKRGYSVFVDMYFRLRAFYYRLPVGLRLLFLTRKRIVLSEK